MSNNDDDFNYEPEELDPGDGNEREKLYQFEDVEGFSEDEKKKEENPLPKPEDKYFKDEPKSEDENNKYNQITTNERKYFSPDEGDQGKKPSNADDNHNSDNDNFEMEKLEVDSQKSKENKPNPFLEPDKKDNEIESIEELGPDGNNNGVPDASDKKGDQDIPSRIQESKNTKIDHGVPDLEPQINNVPLSPKEHIDSTEKNPVKEDDLDDLLLDENEKKDQKKEEPQQIEEPEEKKNKEKTEEPDINEDILKQIDDDENYNDFNNDIDNGVFLTGQKVVPVPKKENPELPSPIKKRDEPPPKETKKPKEDEDGLNFDFIIDKSNFLGKQDPKKQGKKGDTKTSLGQAEMIFNSLKVEIAKILNTPQTQEPGVLRRENAKMLNIFSSLNEVVSLITKGQKMPINPKAAKKSTPEQLTIEKEQNDKKILENYEKEYAHYKKIIDNYNNSTYVDNVHKEIYKIKKDTAFYKKEIAELKNEEKYNDILISQQIKNPSKPQMKLKKTEMDYDKLLKELEKLKSQILAKSQKIQENEVKIKEIKELRAQLAQFAKDTYDITEFKDVKKIAKKEKETERTLNSLKRNLSILDGAKISNKKKYEKIIQTKEKTIYNKEEIKLTYLKKLKDISSKCDELNLKIKEIYEPLLEGPSQNQEEKKSEELNPEDFKSKPDQRTQKPELSNTNPKDSGPTTPITQKKSPAVKKNPVIPPVKQPVKIKKTPNEGKPYNYPLPPVKTRKPGFNFKLGNVVQNQYGMFEPRKELKNIDNNLSNENINKDDEHDLNKDISKDISNNNISKDLSKDINKDIKNDISKDMKNDTNNDINNDINIDKNDNNINELGNNTNINNDIDNDVNQDINKSQSKNLSRELSKEEEKNTEKSHKDESQSGHSKKSKANEDDENNKENVSEQKSIKSPDSPEELLSKDSMGQKGKESNSMKSDIKSIGSQNKSENEEVNKSENNQDKESKSQNPQQELNTEPKAPVEKTEEDKEKEKEFNDLFKEPEKKEVQQNPFKVVDDFDDLEEFLIT